MMTALDFLVQRLEFPPMHLKGNKPVRPSNSELRRWLDNGSVLINGARPKAKDEIELPVTQLVFFPGKRKQTTLM